MPNWCEGILKLRGSKENLLKFVLEKLKIEVVKDYQVDIKLKEWDVIWFEGSRRMFVTQPTHWWFIDDEQEKHIQCLDIKQAWDIDVEYLLEIAKDYNLDLKVNAFEMGMQFTREILIEEGNLKRNIVKEYENTDEYKWDVYDPRLGG